MAIINPPMGDAEILLFNLQGIIGQFPSIGIDRLDMPLGDLVRHLKGIAQHQANQRNMNEATPAEAVEFAMSKDKDAFDRIMEGYGWVRRGDPVVLNPDGSILDSEHRPLNHPDFQGRFKP